MKNNVQGKTVKYLTPFFGILCGVIASAIFFSLLLGAASSGTALGEAGFSPLLTIPILLAAFLYAFWSWLSSLRRNKLFGWATFVGFLTGIVVISCFLYLIITVLISPA